MKNSNQSNLDMPVVSTENQPIFPKLINKIVPMAKKSISFSEVFITMKREIRAITPIGDFMGFCFPSMRLFTDEKAKLPNGRWVILMVPFPMLWQLSLRSQSSDSALNAVLVTRVVFYYQGYFFDMTNRDDCEAIELIKSSLGLQKGQILSAAYFNIVKVGALTYKDVNLILKYSRPVISCPYSLKQGWLSDEVFNYSILASERWYLPRRLEEGVAIHPTVDLANDILDSYILTSIPPDVSLASAEYAVFPVENGESID
jgi:hypothetical protein